MVEAVKNPAKIRAGIAGSHARWGDRRIVRLDNLPSEVAAVIRALVSAAETAKADPVIETTGAGQEARRDAGEPSAV
jgi:hypothetical protein